MLAFAIDDLPDPEHPKAPHLSTELSTRGRKYHKKRLAIAAASCAIAWTAAYTTTRALQFSRLCSAADTNDVVLIIASVLAWGQLPLSTTAVVYLARDVWAGKRMADAQRLWGWRVYVLPVVVPVHVCLGVVKGLRALVGGYQWLEAFKKFFGAVDAGEAEEMLLPRYAEVIEAADGPERAAAGAWC
ncbi:hypothetical protein MMC17_002800 [Xylographa soralifera]|nr:hypothetical protein [Xylographa soralifera]